MHRGLVVNVVPGHLVRCVVCYGLSNGENELLVECLAQQLQNLFTLCVVWQIGLSLSTVKILPRLWVFFLSKEKRSWKQSSK